MDPGHFPIYSFGDFVSHGGENARIELVALRMTSNLLVDKNWLVNKSIRSAAV